MAKYKEDYEITIKADKSNVSYWTCKRKGECCNNLSLEDYKALYEMVEDISKGLYNQIKRMQEYENSD